MDRYKYSVYTHISDHFLRHIVTCNGADTRFHACERFDRCEHVKVSGRAAFTASGTHVVYINPVNMSRTKWGAYLEETRSRLEGGDHVDHLVRTPPLNDASFCHQSIIALPIIEAFSITRTARICVAF